MTTLVVSPHLDDAVLSVPALLRSLAAQGERVVVLTVFSEGDAGYARRREEDRTALALLGAEPCHLGLEDAPYRRGLPRTFRALVLTELAADDADAAMVAHTLAERLRSIAPQAILLPLGVGEHVDHRIVHAAHRGLTGRVGFYEDRPYALVPHAVEARLARLGATVDGARSLPSPAAAAAFLASARTAPYVHAYLPEAERDACLQRLAESLSAPAASSHLVLRRERFPFDPPALAAAVAAVCAYASQRADLFGEADVASALSSDDGRYEERIYWRG